MTSPIDADRARAHPARAFRVLGRVVLVAALVYGLMVAGLVMGRKAFIYPFRDGVDASQALGVPRARAVTFAAADGTEVIAWLAPPLGDRPVILYFMGNAGALPFVAPRLAEFAHRGFGIAALNYRGAGGAAGTPGEAALVSDALVLHDRLEDLMGAPVGRRVIYGSSLGAAVAVQLAAERDAEALILETPFAELCETAEYQFPLMPACLVLPDDRWDSLAVIGAVGMPVLVLHGTADGTIPLAHAERLFAAARVPKQIIQYPGGRHNDLRLHGAGIDAIRFIEGL